MPKISELEVVDFNKDMIDHCFYVQDMNTPNITNVPLSKVFEYIKESAMQDEGLTVELRDDKMFFIKGKQ